MNNTSTDDMNDNIEQKEDISQEDLELLYEEIIIFNHSLRCDSTTSCIFPEICPRMKNMIMHEEHDSDSQKCNICSKLRTLTYICNQLKQFMSSRNHKVPTIVDLSLLLIELWDNDGTCFYDSLEEEETTAGVELIDIPVRCADISQPLLSKGDKNVKPIKKKKRYVCSNCHCLKIVGLHKCVRTQSSGISNPLSSNAEAITTSTSIDNNICETYSGALPYGSKVVERTDSLNNINNSDSEYEYVVVKRKKTTISSDM